MQLRLDLTRNDEIYNNLIHQMTIYEIFFVSNKKTQPHYRNSNEFFNNYNLREAKEISSDSFDYNYQFYSCTTHSRKIILLPMPIFVKM